MPQSKVPLVDKSRSPPTPLDEARHHRVMAEAGNDFPSDIKKDYTMTPKQILEVQEGALWDVSPSESRRVLRKIDFWWVVMNF